MNETTADTNGMAQPPARRYSILTVEDDPVVRDSIAFWLEDAGFTVLQTDNGLTGLHLFREEHPDAVLLDLGIPGIEGNRLLEMLAGESPNTPIIIVSGRAEIDDAIAAFKSGAWDYITKPIVNMDMLEKTVRNCLEFKVLKERVAIAENRYFGLVQSLPVVVFSMDSDMRFHFINATSTPVLGFTPEAVLADPALFARQVHPADAHKVRRALTTAFATPNRPFFLEFRFLHNNGYPVQVQAKSVSITPPDGETPGRMEGVLTDVTERAVLEKMLVQHEKLNLLGAMADEIAHEFRNPIFALAGFARRLRTKHPDMEETAIILQEAERLEQLLGRVKDYLTPIAVNMEQCSLEGIMRYCMDFMLPRFTRSNITPVVDLAGSLPPLVSDSDVLTQIGMNLLANASSHLNPGESLTLRSYATPGQQHVQVEVPLPPAMPDPELALMPFAADGPVQGLAVSHRLAKDLNGMLAVRKEDTTLSLTLSLPAS